MRRSWSNRLLAPLVKASIGLVGRASAGDLDGLIPSWIAEPAPDGAVMREALATLLASCAEEADLSALGRLALRWDVRQKLANVRRLADAEQADPTILRERIATPLVISGMPRSGTTFLQRLLVADPRALAPRCWQTIYPYPTATGRDRRVARVDRQLRQFAWLAPEMRSVHPLDSRSLQECTEITAQVFQSLRFEMLYSVPRYKAWLAAAGHAAAYRFHRRFLQHLQHQGDRPGHWVLKAPDHVFALQELRDTYPDARVIFLHRDPLRVLPSVAQLTEIVRAPFTRRIDRAAIGRQVTDDWARGAQTLVRELRQPSLPPRQVLHLSYAEVTRWPLATVQRIYRHFDMELDAAAESAMAELIAASPRGGYGDNRYSFEAFGITPAEIRARFAEYLRASPAAADVEDSRPRRAYAPALSLTPPQVDVPL